MAVHVSGVTWMTRLPTPDGTYHYVSTYGEDSLSINVPDGDHWRLEFIISRRDARLLARRIHECLDATTSKAARKT